MFERMKQKRDEGGFTLIELLIVIIILAILAAIVVFAVGSTGTSAAQAACKADAKSVSTAIEAYKAQHPSTGYPPDYAALTTTDASGGPWLKAAPSTKDYSIEFNSAGQVWAAPPTGGGYQSSEDIDASPLTACSAPPVVAS
jgi:prepilin-type N-terminal cleavage/methylation domain-containing protein